MNTCTKVFLRKKEISGDRISLYLDFYPPIRNPHTNRLSRRESLGIYLYGHPSNAREREFNASMMEKQRLSAAVASSSSSTSSSASSTKRSCAWTSSNTSARSVSRSIRSGKSFTSTSRTVNTHSKVGQDAHSKMGHHGEPNRRYYFLYCIWTIYIGTTMLTVVEIQTIVHLYRSGDYSRRGIARKLGISRTTVDKVLAQYEATQETSDNEALDNLLTLQPAYNSRGRKPRKLSQSIATEIDKYLELNA